MQPKELQQQIHNAMRNHERNRLSMLRQVLQAVRQIEIDQQRETTEADVTAATKQLLRVTNEEINALEQSSENHAKRIAALKQQTDMLSEILPTQMSEADTEPLVKEIIQETNATSMRDMGLVMARIKERTQGSCDMRYASSLVKSLLSK